MEGFEQVVALQSTVFPPEESYSINQILELCTLETVLYKSFWNRNRLCGLLFFNVGRTMVLSYDSRVLVYDAGLLPYDTRVLAYDSHFIVYQ